MAPAIRNSSRGIGFNTFVELTAIGPEYYGEGGQHISAQETTSDGKRSISMLALSSGTT